MKDGLIRVAAVTPKVKVADVETNRQTIERYIRECAAKGCAAAVFPELSLTAYTCGDLFLNSALLHAAETALARLMQDTADCDIVCAVGVPVPFGGGLYNAAAVFRTFVWAWKSVRISGRQRRRVSGWHVRGLRFLSTSRAVMRLSARLITAVSL